MARILVVYSTTDGHTRTICDRLRRVIEAQGHAVTIVCVGDAVDSDLEQFDRIVVGASIRYGKHSAPVFDFIRRNLQALGSKPSAFFSVNVVARKPGKNRPETNPYVKKFLQKTSWRPTQVAVFAGRIDYPRYGFLDRTVIRLIMWITKGPTGRNAVVEFTDWGQVDAFGSVIAGM